MLLLLMRRARKKKKEIYPLLHCSHSCLNCPAHSQEDLKKIMLTFTDALLLRHSTTNKSPSLAYKRTRRSDQDLFSSSQFFSAENFSSLSEWDEPVREISDQDLLDLGFPIPTPSSAPPVTTTRYDNSFVIKNSEIFVINSCKYFK